jgi:3',5'-cyclic AMP phosphodiesterase CpdA
MANWFQMIPNTYGRFDLPQSVSAPYDRMQQPPVVILYDGVGPYYAVEKDGYKFIVLDTCSWLLGDRQYAFLRREVANATGPVLIVLHHSILATGSIYDGAVLWDREPLLELLVDEPKVLGVVSGHVHLNRVWDVRGKKVITTADRGWSRWITLDDGLITDIEPLGNTLYPGSGAIGACTADTNPERPFIDRYEYPVEVIAPRSFTCYKSGLWTHEALGWDATDGPGGLDWRFRNLGAAADFSWFGLNFRSTTPWKVIVERDGNRVLAREGLPGDNVVITEPLDLTHFKTYKVRLEQQAPACGHASPYLVFGAQPVKAFSPYPPSSR